METIEDIVRELREHSGEMNPPQIIFNEDGGIDMSILADRIEAAHKREREAGAEAAQICGEIGEVIGREAACKEKITDCNRLGNAAKMRMALELCQRVIHCAIIAGILRGDDAYDALNKSKAALSAPPRYCDVMSLESARKLWFAKEIMPRLIGGLPLGEGNPV